MVEYSKQRGH